MKIEYSDWELHCCWQPTFCCSCFLFLNFLLCNKHPPLLLITLVSVAKLIFFLPEGLKMKRYQMSGTQLVVGIQVLPLPGHWSSIIRVNTAHQRSLLLSDLSNILNMYSDLSNILNMCSSVVFILFFSLQISIPVLAVIWTHLDSSVICKNVIS